MRIEEHTFKVIIVDDEPLGRERICSLLAQETDMDVVAECRNGVEAVEAIREIRPDIVFLDVQMPELDGFGVIQTIGPEQMPAIVFVTAYDRFAVHAFDVHAIDYLVKPFEVGRFQEAIKQLRTRLSGQDVSHVEVKLGKLLDHLQEERPKLDRIMVKTSRRMYFVRVSDIDWIESAGNYIELHEGKKTHLVRQTMHAIEKQLDPNQFYRIHRSKIVNLDQVKEFVPMFNGEYEVIMLDNSRHALSRRYRKLLDRFGL